MGRRILNDALRSIVNAEKRGKASVELKPISTVISSFLKVMKERGNKAATIDMDFPPKTHIASNFILSLRV
ncbi:hypothetical protein L6164_029637 [Bauhinia variegata]|uniref:Uncharacterized protein n=1 Tax=Bauhinia variegata TaxID=167791 RepID=A0ACB9LA77_BAUVA|nr:hypothetical protein L6164_029637 [Bauhinia variegata]